MTSADISTSFSQSPHKHIGKEGSTGNNILTTFGKKYYGLTYFFKYFQPLVLEFSKCSLKRFICGISFDGLGGGNSTIHFFCVSERKKCGLKLLTFNSEKDFSLPSLDLHNLHWIRNVPLIWYCLKCFLNFVMDAAFSA